MDVTLSQTPPLQVSSPAPTARGIVFDIRKFSIHDGPGIRTTVFFKGCPLKCLWCHNPESQSIRPERYFRPARCIACGTCLKACPHQAISLNGSGLVTDPQRCDLCGGCAEACPSEAREIIGREMSAAEVMKDIRSDLSFYEESHGGATFSGGEPLMQPDFLEALLIACRKEEIHTALDTCGFAPWATIERMLPYTDLFLFDLKHMDDALHRQYTGVSNRLILENLKRISALGRPIYLRVPIIPGLNDDPQNLQETARLAASLPSVRRVDILPYHNSASAKYERLEMAYQLAEIVSPSTTRMEEIAHSLQNFGLTVHIGG